MEGKKEKQTRIPIGDIAMGRDSLRNFINTYHYAESKKYVVSELPQPMYHEVKAIPPMTCGPFRDNFVEIDFWINGNNASSILHKDAFNTLNCVINGTKDWKLVSKQHNQFIYQAWEGVQEAGYGGYSLINPEKVDMIKFPKIQQIPNWQHTVINKGDCLYLPSQMWHHVKSSGSNNVAVAYLFSRFDSKDQNISFADCTDDQASLPLNQIDVDWQFNGKDELTMGYMELPGHRANLYSVLNKNGKLSKKKILKMMSEMLGGKDEKYIRTRTIQLLKVLLGIDENFNIDTVKRLNKNQLRIIGKAVELQEASNTKDFEYSYIRSETIRNVVMEALVESPDGISFKVFHDLYVDTIKGSEMFAEKLFNQLTTQVDSIEDEDGQDKTLTQELYEANIDIVSSKFDFWVLDEDREDEEEDRDPEEDDRRQQHPNRDLNIQPMGQRPDFPPEEGKEDLSTRNNRKTKTKQDKDEL